MEDIIKTNLIPFTNKNLYSDKQKLSFLNIIKGIDDIPSMPLIPKIYFTEDKGDSNGSSIINTYYNLKKAINELIIIKDFIVSIIETFKYELEKIQVSKRTYNLKKNKLHQSIKKTLEKSFPYQDDFISFVKDFIQTKYSLLSENNDISPLFKLIFENEYTGSSKTKNFLLKLFNKYIKTRTILIDLIDKNYGLIAFDSFFNLNDIMTSQSKTKKDDNKLNKKIINYNSYIYGFNNKENNNNLISSKNKNKQHTDLSKKINIFNLLYINAYSANYYKENHLKTINENYKIMNDTITDLLSEKDIDNLYNILIKSLTLDFYTIDFIYKYVDPKIFNNSIDIHYIIKNNIYKDINTFSSYYDRYIEWFYNKFGKETDNISESYDLDSDFNKFYNQIIKEIDA
jgi:hypothetical protein